MCGVNKESWNFVEKFVCSASIFYRMFETMMFLIDIDVRDVSCFSYVNVNIPYILCFSVLILCYFSKLRSGIGRSDKKGFAYIFYNDIV
jgi:hypothetical protein